MLGCRMRFVARNVHNIGRRNLTVEYVGFRKYFGEIIYPVETVLPFKIP